MAAEKKKKPRRPRWRRILRGIIEIVGVLFFAVVVFAWWATKTGRASDWAREEMLRALSERCDIEAEFGGVTFDPFPPTVEITQLKMKHKDGRPLLSLDDAIATLQLLPLFAQRIQLDRVFVLLPKASIEIENGRILDLPKCVQPPKQKPTAAPIVLGIRELIVNRGSFDLRIDHAFKGVFPDFDIALEPRSGSAGSNVRIGFEEGRIWIEDRELPVQRFRFLGELEGLLTEPRVALLDKLELQLGRINLEADGSIDLLGPVYDAHLHVFAPIDSIHDFLADFPKAEGDVQVDVRVQGTAAAPHGTGWVELKNGKIDTFEVGDDVKVEFAVDHAGATIPSLEVKLGEGKVKGKGRIDFDLKTRRFPIRIDTEAEEVSIGRVLDCVGVKKAWVDWRANGEGHVAGTLRNPTEIKGSFDYRIHDFYVYDGPWDRPEVRGKKDVDPKYVMLHPGTVDVRGKWDWTDKGVHFSDADVVSGDTSGTADAYLSFAHAEGVRIQAHLPSFDFKDLGPIAGVKFGGYGSITGGIFGSYSRVAGGGSIDLEDTTVAGIPFGRTRAELSWHDDVAIDLSDIHAKLGETEYSGTLAVKVKGEVPFWIRGQIDKGRIEDVLVPFGVRREDWGMPGGEVRGTFELLGPILRLTGPIDLDVANAKVLDETFEKGHVSGRLEKGAVVADDVHVFKHGAEIHGSGRIDPFLGEVKARARTKGMTLQKIDLVKASQPTLDADLLLDLALAGSLSTVTGTLTALGTRVVAGPIELQDGRLVGKIKNKTVAIKGRVLGDALRVDGELELGKGLPYRTALELKEYDVPRLVAALNGHLRYKGLAAGKARLSGSLVDWPQSSGEIQLEKGEFETESVHLETAAPATFVMRNGVLDTKRISFVGSGTKLTAEGKLGARIIDAKVVGTVNLGIAEVLSPSIDKIGGTLSLDASIGGSPASMNLVGTGRIDNGNLQWRNFYSRLSNFSANLLFSQSTILIDKADGRWADGKVGMTGNLLLDNYRVKNVSLQIALEDAYPRFSFGAIKELSGVLNGNLSLEGTPARLLVRGDLDVARGNVVPQIDLAVVGKRRTAAANAYDPSAEILDLDIGIHAKEPVHLKNQAVQAEMKGDMRLTGTNQRLGMLGSSSVLRGGHAIFLGRDYEILSGTIDYTERYRFSMRYDLWVQAEACSAQIRVNLVGTLDKLDATYSSNPSMDDANIVNCLLFGRRLQDLDIAGRVTNVPWFQALGLGRQVRQVLPVDDFDVTQEYSTIGHTYEPRVLVAKDLTLNGGSVRLEYSSSLVRSEDRRFALRYRITPNLTLQGSWVTKPLQIQPTGGDLGLDLKYRWEW